MITANPLTANPLIDGLYKITLAPAEVKRRTKELLLKIIGPIEISTARLLPSGGTTGQVLKKQSNTDYDTIWQNESGGGGGVDPTAIHTDVDSEIDSLTEKASPVNNDILIIEDSGDTYKKKKVKISSLPDKNETFTYIFKTVIEGKTNDTTLADDNYLKFDINSTGVYMVEGELHFAANSAPGIKIRINFTGTSGEWAQRVSYMVAASNTLTSVQYTAQSTSTLLSATPGQGYYSFKLYLNVTGIGRLSVQWAQNTSHAHGVYMKEASYIRYSKVV